MTLPHPNRIKELFDYNPETGVLYRKESVSNLGPNYPYTEPSQIKIEKGARVLSYRIIWCWYYGYWPKGVIDHINGNRWDNRIVNLRDITKVGNGLNRKKKVIRRQYNRYVVKIQYYGESIYIRGDTKGEVQIKHDALLARLIEQETHQPIDLQRKSGG